MRLLSSLFILGKTVALTCIVAMLWPALEADAQRAQSGRAGSGDVLESLELRSVISMGGRPQFSLRDPARDISFWIALNETRHGIQVIEYVRDSNQIVVRYDGRTRRIGLSDIEITPLSTAENSEASTGVRPAFGGGERSDQRNPEERMRHILETWDNQIRQNPRLRDIDEHMGEYYQEFQNVRQSMWTTTDHDSPEFQRLRERRQELREEMHVLHTLAQREIEDDPAFEDIDRGALVATLRHRHMGSPQRQNE